MIMVILFFFFLDTNFDECPKCKEFMPDFQEAAGYLDNLEDGKVILNILLDLEVICNSFGLNMGHSKFALKNDVEKLRHLFPFRTKLFVSVLLISSVGFVKG